MASEPFVIQLESFDGGFAASPYTGAENQYSDAFYCDHWTEPGTLMSIPSIREFEITSSASYKAMLLAVTRTTDASKKYVGVAATNASYTLSFVQLNEGDATFTPLVRLDSYYQTAPSLTGRYPNPILEYADDLLTASATTLIQNSQWATGASLYTSAGNWTGAVSDIIENFGYAYVSKVASSNSSPGAIARYDLVTSASLVSDGASMLDPAVQLSPGWGPTCMANFGDYIAISALKTTQVDLLAWSLLDGSRIYIWDGISNTFDKKVEVPGETITAIYTAGGQLYAFSSKPGGISILRYAGGDVFQTVGFLPCNTGRTVDTDVTDTQVPFVRKQAISCWGSKLYIGVTVNGGTNSNGNLFTFDTKTGVVDLILRPSSTSTHTVFFNNEINFASFQTASNASFHYKMGNTPALHSEFRVTSTTRFAPMGKKMKIKRILVRHSYLASSSDYINLYLNYNITGSPRTVGATQVLNATGSSLNTPGIGDNAAYEHAYTFQQTDGTPMPLLDSFNLSMHVVSDFAAYHNPRVFLPIVIEGEYIDSPN